MSDDHIGGPDKMVRDAADIVRGLAGRAGMPPADFARVYSGHRVRPLTRQTSDDRRWLKLLKRHYQLNKQAREMGLREQPLRLPS